MKILFLLFLLISCNNEMIEDKGEPKMERVLPSNKNILYTGRFDFSNPEKPVSYFTGSSISIKLKGSKAAFNIQGDSNFVNVIINGEVVEVVDASKIEDNLLIINPEHLKDSVSFVEIFKRTEFQYGGAFALNHIEIDGVLLEKPQEKKRKIEFIGNSITCGYGNEDSVNTHPYSLHTQNGYETFATKTSRALNADFHKIAYSGKGVAVNFAGDKENTLVDLYNRINPHNADLNWKHENWNPQVVVVNLGTNDFSSADALGFAPTEEEFVDACLSLINMIKKNYPEASVILVDGPMLSDYWPNDSTGAVIPSLTLAKEYLDKAADIANSDSDELFVHRLSFTPNSPEVGYGADWHPNVAQHRINAQELVKKIQDIKMWY